MIATTMTPTAILTEAGKTVNEFGSLILLVCGISMGIWGVLFLVRQIRKSRRR